MNFLESIDEASRIIRTASHLTYVTFPLVKEKRLLLKILVEVKKAITKCINSMLQFDYLYKRVGLTTDSEKNIQTFITKTATRFNINREEIKQVLELFSIIEKHNKSSMEFVKDEKIVILNGNSQTTIITIERTKEFISLAENLLKKTEKGIISST